MSGNTNYPYTSYAIYQQASVQRQQSLSNQAAPAQCFCITESLVQAASPSQLVENNGTVGIFYDASSCGAGCSMNLTPFLPGSPGSYSA
jgi:hypothetical protein